MNQEVTYETLDKRNTNKEIEQIRSIMERIINNDPIFEETFNDHVDHKQSKEMSLKNLKNVLSDLSIKLGYDLEPIKDKISVRHSNLTEISFFILKEALYDYLHKREKLISTAIFVEEMGENVMQNKNSVLNTETKTKNEVSFNHQIGNNENEILSETDPEIQLLILQRSLYILKKKFDLNNKEINYIYNKYANKNKLDLVIDTRNDQFIELMEDILKINNFSFNEIKKPNELFRKELNLMLNDDSMTYFNESRNVTKNILAGLNEFMRTNRKKYNKIMREKREKGKVDLNNFQEIEEEENFPDLQTEAENDLLNLIPEKEEDDRTNYLPENNKLENEVFQVEDYENERQKTLPKNENESNNLKTDENLKLEQNILNQKDKNKDKNKENIEENKEDKEMHPNEIETIPNENENQKEIDLENEEENKKIKSLEQNLENEIKTYVKDNQTESKKNSLKMNNNTENNSDLSINPILDKKNSKKFKEVLEKIRNKNKNNSKANSDNNLYLLIEILPLIIADFLHYNQKIVLLLNNEDFQSELRALFDNEILQRLGESVKHQLDEEKTANLKTLLLDKLNLEKNIRIYEDLFVKKTTCRENTIFIEQMLTKLKTQKNSIESRIKNIQNDTETKIEIKEPNNPNNNVSKILNTSAVNKSVNMNIGNNSIANITKIIPKRFLSKEEIRSSALKEMFYFYSRQHQLAGHLVTFDDIANKTDRMDLGEFMKFCHEFKIQLKKEKLAEIFKKSASNTKQMTSEEFVQSLGTISIKINEEKKNEIIKKINKIKSESKKRNNPESNRGASQDKNNLKENKINLKNVKITDGKINVNSENKNNEENKDLLENKNNEEKEYSLIPEVIEISDPIPSENQENKIPKINNQNKTNPSSNLNKSQSNQQEENEILPTYEITKLKLQIEELKNKSFEALLEELYLYLSIDNEKEYRSKMKGYTLPFKTHDKQYRIPNDKLMQRARKVDPRTAEEIKRILKERKEEKLKTKLENERIEKLKLFEQKRQIEKVNKQIAKDRERLIIGKESKYTEIKQKHEIYEKEKDTKLTWDALEHMNYNQFISNRDDDFNPNGLIDEYSDDDDLSFLYEENKNGKNEEKQNYLLNNSNNSGRKSNNQENKNNISTDLDRSFEKNENYNGLKNSSKSPKQIIGSKHIKELSNKKYMNEKTEMKAKELEKEWENKQAQLIQKYDNMVAKSQEKVKKFNNKLGAKIK